MRENLFTALLSVTALVLLLAPFRTPPEPELPAAEWVERYRAHELEMERLAALHLEAAVVELNREFDAVLANVPLAAARIARPGTCFDLCRRMVRDRLTGSHTTESELARLLEPEFIAPCLRAKMVAEEELAQLLLRLDEADNRFRAELAAGLGAPPLVPVAVPHRLAAGVEEGRALGREVALANAAAAGGAALEVVFVRSTVLLLKRVLGSAVARMAGTASAAGIAAAADGPLPVGDAVAGVLAVGGLGWTTYDIYQARKVLPGELEKSLQETVGECRKETEASLRERAAQGLFRRQKQTLECFKRITE